MPQKPLKVTKKAKDPVGSQRNKKFEKSCPIAIEIKKEIFATSEEIEKELFPYRNH